MAVRETRRMHCPACDQQIPVWKALFGLAKRPFHCARCDELIEISSNLRWALVAPAYLVFWRIKAEFGDTAMTALAFVVILMVLAILQLLLTPVARAEFN